MTRDHVIARGLFPSPLPEFMVTVPACDDCNGEKAKHEDYLRDMLVVDADTENRKVAKELLTGKVFRASERNQSLVMRAAKSKGKLEPVYSPGGNYLGHGFSFPLEGERVNHIFSLIVRGLYYKLTGRCLPQDCKFDVRRLTASEFDEFWEKLQKIKFNGPYRLGDGVFTCLFLYAVEESAIGATVGATRNVARNIVEEWLGPNTRVITNPAGDKVFLSEDGLRRVRADFNNPSPHNNPHLHVEELIGGKWMKSGPIYPTDVPHN